MHRKTRPGHTRACWRALPFLFVTFAGASAFGDENVADPHLAAGRVAAAHGDWMVAINELTFAYDAKPGIGVLRDLANAHFQMQHWLEAWDLYKRVAESLPAADVAASEVPSRVRTLESRTTRVVVVTDASASVVTIDGKVVDSRGGRAESRVLPGPHVVHALRSRVPDFTAKIEAVAGEDNVLDARSAPSREQSSGGTSPAEDQSAQTPSPAVPKSIRAITTDGAAPRIDGVLDEPLWHRAPVDTSFLSGVSKPWGKASAEPTAVQVAYDAENLYVAFTCRYSSVRPRDDSFPLDETTNIGESEGVAVLVDPLYDRANALAFGVSRTGVPVDFELAQGGTIANMAWRGLWYVATRRSQDMWTAEFRIPWGSMRLPRRDGPFEVGINFRRKEPVVGERSLWSLDPPATTNFDTNFFGKLEGLSDARPRNTLFVQPYVALAYDQYPRETRSALSDFAGTARDGGHFRGYAGLYARYQPPGPLRFDGTINPDFSAVVPDQAITNFDRFELEFPETRTFFIEDNPRFAFGVTPETQLFYSRRIGLRNNLAGIAEQVPLIYGAKSVLRSGGTEVALMNVGISAPQRTISHDDNVTVLRVNQTFAEGRRVGAIMMTRGTGAEYVAGGVDGNLTLFDRHFSLTGFYARTEGQKGSSGAGAATMSWAAQDYYANLSYADIGTNFDAQLGYVPLTGVRMDTIAAGYTPVLRNDLVQQVGIEGKIVQAKDRFGTRVFDRGTLNANALMIDHSYIETFVQPATEEVTEGFPLASGRIEVAPGKYDVLTVGANATTPPRRLFVAGLGYSSGDLFAGLRRTVTVTAGYNPGRFTGSVSNQFFFIRYAGREITKQALSARLNYNYAPLAKTSLIVEQNALNNRAVVQLVTTYTFGALSTLVFNVQAVSGSTLTERARDWFVRPAFSSMLSFAYGLTAL